MYERRWFLIKQTIMVALDVSTKKTGVAVFGNGKLKKYTLLDKTNISSSDERVEEMALEIIKTLDTMKPVIVSIEDTYCGNNPSVQKVLSRLQGVVFGWCISNNADFNLYLPSTWRKHIEGFPTKAKRAECKAFSIQYVKDKYSIDVTDDVADAVCIGEATVKIYDGQ